MRIYSHPQTRVPISGMRLAPGAILQAGDKYASSDGKWRLAEPCSTGMVLHRGWETFWVRPNVEPSPGSSQLIVCLAQADASLVRRRSSWKLITPQHRAQDPRVDLRADSLFVGELLTYGLIAQSERDPEVYTLTSDGRSFARSI